MPPTKPTLPVSVIIPATTPTRKDPSFALNVREATLGLSTTMSTRAKFWSGYSAATVVSASAWSKPMQMMMM